ncbi:MAG: FeoB-associated Cys-rich membrane protein [Mesonia sp.]|nr:FeoB-associated Cys-rich membrane protein [Mesonia sp.]MAN28276.1 FeoB-associated Cys-rich membrane protein [Mesonia sp.]MAQ41467.1 FeoB-associated Cys-rich membrane protein [Mesonia sp.]
MIQEILVFITFLIAVGFLVKKFFWKSPKKATGSESACGKSDCGCH